MKERLRDLLSEVGESFDYLRSDVRNLSRYMAELEELIERYRTFAASATLSAPADRAAIRKLLCENTQGFGSAARQATSVARHGRAKGGKASSWRQIMGGADPPMTHCPRELHTTICTRQMCL